MACAYTSDGNIKTEEGIEKNRQKSVKCSKSNSLDRKKPSTPQQLSRER